MTLPKGYTSEDKYCNDPECEQTRKGIKHKFHGRKKIYSKSESRTGVILSVTILVLVTLYWMIPGSDGNPWPPSPSDWCNLVLGQSGQISGDIQQVCWGVDMAVLILIIIGFGVIIANKIKPKLQKKPDK